MGEGIGVHFGILLAVKSVPRVGAKVENVMECRDGIRWRLGRFEDRRDWEKRLYFCEDYCVKCI